MDFERVMFDQSQGDKAFFMLPYIEKLAVRYRGAQAWYRHEGLLRAA
jgi:hypothetical protein